VIDCKLTILGYSREHSENLSLMLNSIEIKHVKQNFWERKREQSKNHQYASILIFFFHILNTLCGSHFSVSARVKLDWNQKGDRWKWAVGDTSRHATVAMELILTGHCWCQRYIWVEKELTRKIIWRSLWSASPLDHGTPVAQIS